MNNLFQVRVVGVLIEQDKILLVNQKVSSDRSWSLPGGRLENGETLEQGVIREVLEETGLSTRVIRLLYVCDKPDSTPPLLHITFLLERESGELALPTNEFDSNPIHDVRMVRIDELMDYGFSDQFRDIVKNRFENSGRYVGLKKNIGL
jgi:ADP-ribose pyrophosphatase YjhB (NUDIX family)